MRLSLVAIGDRSYKAARSIGKQAGESQKTKGGSFSAALKTDFRFAYGCAAKVFLSAGLLGTLSSTMIFLGLPLAAGITVIAVQFGTGLVPSSAAAFCSTKVARSWRTRPMAAASWFNGPSPFLPSVFIESTSESSSSQTTLRSL